MRRVDEVSAIRMSGEYAGKAQGLQLAANARDMNRNTVGLRFIIDAPNIDQKLAFALPCLWD